MSWSLKKNLPKLSGHGHYIMKAQLDEFVSKFYLSLSFHL